MINKLQNFSKQFRQDLFRLQQETKWGDLPSMLSCLDILICLYFGQYQNQQILKHRPLEPSWEERDYFVLSKIQSLLAHYLILAKRGYFNEAELLNTKTKHPDFPQLPHIKTKGINGASRISGLGLGIAAGLALSKRNNHVFCLCGDGEIQNGNFWENLLFIQQHQLKNLTIIIDYNQLQLTNQIRSSANILPLGEKISKFGIRPLPVANGHNFTELVTAFEKARTSLKPCVIIAHTIKGKGISFIENRANYSYQPFSKNELTIISNELT